MRLAAEFVLGTLPCIGAEDIDMDVSETPERRATLAGRSPEVRDFGVIARLESPAKTLSRLFDLREARRTGQVCVEQERAIPVARSRLAWLGSIGGSCQRSLTRHPPHTVAASRGTNIPIVSPTNPYVSSC